MEKSPDAFRTISEVADLLDTPAHVLRFWESRFPQIRPVKRAGGRRYYRPSDVALLSGIKRLLHGDGLTIRGVQKVLRENGIRHVMALAEGPIAEDALDGALTESGDPAVTEDLDRPEGADVLAFPDMPPPRPAPEAPTLPLWSAAPPGEPQPDIVAAAGMPTVQAGTDITSPAMASDAAAAPQAALPAEVDADDLPAFDDTALPPRIASALRAVRRSDVFDRRAELAELAARLRELRAQFAAAAGVGGT